MMMMMMKSHLGSFVVENSNNKKMPWIFCYAQKQSADFSHENGRVTLMWCLDDMKSKGTICLNTFRPEQNGRHFADGSLECILVDENYIWFKFPLFPNFFLIDPTDDLSTFV